MQDKKQRGVAYKVREIAEPIAKNLNLNIWDIKYLKEGANMYLRVFISKNEPVTISDCENMSHALDEPLEKSNIIKQSYILEVCSPGLERKLTKEEHFKQFIGSKIKIKLIKKLEDGNKNINGILKDFKDGIISFKGYEDNEILNINIKDTIYVKLDDFDLGG